MVEKHNNRLLTENPAGVLPESTCLSCPVNLERYPVYLRGLSIRAKFNLRFALIAVGLLSLLLAVLIEREEELGSASITTEDGRYILDVRTVEHSALFRSRLTVEAHMRLSSDQSYLCGYVSEIGSPYTNSFAPVSLESDSEYLPRWICHPDLPDAIYARYWLTEDDMMEIGVLPTKGGYQALGGQ